MRKDIFYNFLATALPIAILQLVIFPIVNSRMSLDHYGLIVTCWSLINTFPATLGNAICNSRQLTNAKYVNRGIQGDYTCLVLVLLVPGVAITSVGAGLYGVSILEAGAIALISVLVLLYNYGIVFFRIEINFKKILITNVLLAIGYLIGLAIFLIFGCWYAVFIAGFALALIYIFVKTSWRHEYIGWTRLAGEVIPMTLILIASTLLNSACNYGDRLILYPLLGGSAVSIYYISTLVGKLIVMAISPTATVILSYVTKLKTIEEVPLLKLYALGAVIGIVFWGIACLASYPVLYVLYPHQVDVAMQYVPITTATAVVTSLCSLLNPLALRFRKTCWQIFVNIITFAVLCLASYCLLVAFGLIGFCVGILAAYCMKFLFITILLIKGRDNSRLEASS